MKLPRPFYRLPVRFDAARLRDEVSALPESAWANHPNEITGNSSIRLISVNGGENDGVDGPMAATPHLIGSPYIRQVLASFGVVWSRSRLLRLAPRAGVPQHADINYHWFNRVRLHVPIISHRDVRFYCGDDDVHMAEGEAWIFDNWRLHRVENPVDAARVHLVADTSGSAAFWRFVGQSNAAAPAHEHRYDAARDALPLTERTALRPVMAPAEVDLLLLDLQAELAAPSDPSGPDQVLRYIAMLEALRRDWRQLYQLFGEDSAGWPEYVKLRDSVRAASREQGERLTMRTNRIPAHKVLEGRVLRTMLSLPYSKSADRGVVRRPAPPLKRPIFIVAAPRSGSTLLFETLAVSDEICTLGGEAHWLVESIPELQPGANGVDSNRLEAEHCTDAISDRIKSQLLELLRDSRGRPLEYPSQLRFLEKTPKNALRIPFFERMFPDALFILLWRDPRENIGSIIEAWRAGDWKTYNGLSGFDGPWSFLLPPGWQQMRAKPVEEIAAFQWDSTNRILLDDLASLPRERWHVLNYAQLTASPAQSIRNICAFADLRFDAALEARVAQPLPLSRFTQTRPAAGKWRLHETAIMRMLPAMQDTWRRLQELH